VDEKPVRFTKTEYELLVCLADQAGRLVTQKHLLSTIWGPHSLDSTHYLRIYVTQIRKKIELDPANPKLLITEPGVGYRLNLIETALRPAQE
jgi:two-component system KDP operon response regulator KdpE